MEEIKEYELNYGDYKLKFLNIGAVITEFSYKGNNVVLSFEDYNSYRKNYTNLGSIVGRNAGRIRDGKIDGWKTLPLNQEGKHTLHGGHKFQYKFYDVHVIGNIAKLTVVDTEGDFPGNALVTITFKLGENGLTQTIEAVSDKPTIFDFTNHTYFNLDRSKSILEHTLLIDSDTVLKLDQDLLPIGEMAVSNTAFDFTKPRLIESSLQQGHDQFKYSKFIDHPYVLNGKAVLSTDNLQLEITTDRDYLVVYGGNYIGTESLAIKDNMNYDYSSICLETQGKPGLTNLITDYKATTNFKISVLK